MARGLLADRSLNSACAHLSLHAAKTAKLRLTAKAGSNYLTRQG